MDNRTITCKLCCENDNHGCHPRGFFGQVPISVTFDWVIDDWVSHQKIKALIDPITRTQLVSNMSEPIPFSSDLYVMSHTRIIAVTYNNKEDKQQLVALFVLTVTKIVIC